jgi:hypothetical protein
MRSPKPTFDTRTTREADAKRNMINRKPYRSPELTAMARADAKKVDGAWVSNVGVLHHGKQKPQ